MLAQDPPIHYASADYYLFTDLPRPDLRVWRAMPILRVSNDRYYGHRRNARLCKVLPHCVVPGYEYYIWHDATHDVIADPTDIIAVSQITSERPLALFRHQRWRSPYDEAVQILRRGLDEPALVNAQMSYYKACKMPFSTPVYETPVVVRRLCERCRMVDFMWWEQICRFSSRDQLSVPFVLWSAGVSCTEMEGSAMNNPLIRKVRENVFVRSPRGPSLSMRIRNECRYKWLAVLRRVGIEPKAISDASPAHKDGR